MDKFNPPDPFNFDGDIRKHRKRLKQELEFYLVATEKDNKENKVKPSTLVSCIGPQGREIYNTHCSLRHGRLHTHMQANTCKFTGTVYCTHKIIVFSICVLLLLHISCEQKFFIEGFFIYVSLLDTDLHTDILMFALSQTMYRLEANLNLLANTSTPDFAQYHLSLVHIREIKLFTLKWGNYSVGIFFFFRNTCSLISHSH